MPDHRADWRYTVGSALQIAGAAAALPSVKQTYQHIRDESYRTPEVRHGEHHVQYHMAREVLITAGALGVVVSGLAAGKHLTTSHWAAVVAAVVGFSAAMWSGPLAQAPVAPNVKALRVHTTSTVCLLAGTVVRRPLRRR